MDLPSYQHLAAPLRLFNGPDSLGQLGRELDRLNCRRAVIFCGNTLGRDSSPLALVRTALGERCAGVFAGVRAYSPVPAVRDGTQELQRLGADAVIAVGGGSAIVTARASAILLAEGDDARALATFRDARGVMHSPRLLAAKLPQFVVPTTPTTAMVKAGSAVFEPDSGDRLALFDPKTRAHSVFIHPELIASAPVGLMVSSALDALSGAIEGLCSRSGDPIADALLMHALRLLARHLPKLAGDDSIATRGELMAGAVLCGRGTDHTASGIAAVLGHAVGAGHDVANGIVKAIVLPHVLTFNAEAARPGLVKIASALGLGDTPELAPIIAALRGIFTTLALPSRLREIGVSRDALHGIAEQGMADWFLRGNPRPVRVATELQGVLERAW